MIPVRDVIPSRTTPWTVLLLMAADIAVYAWQLTVSPETHAALVRQYGFVPAEFSALSAFTSLFFHAGWLHLGGNLVALWILGETVEDRLGHGRFLVLYVMAGLAAAATAAWASPGFALPVVGSTGAVAGVAGAYLAMFPQSRVLVLVPVGSRLDLDAAEVPTAFCILVWFMLETLIGVDTVTEVPLAALSVWTAGSSFAAGAAGGWLLKRRDRERVSWWAP